MTKLSDAFADAIDHIEVPERDLVGSVLDEIGGTRAGHRRLMLTIAAAVVVVVGFALVVEPARTAVADWLGIGATGVERVPALDEGEGGSPPISLGDLVDLGAGIDPLPSLGLPDAVFDEPNGVGRGRHYSWPTAGVILSVRTTDGPQDWKSVAADQSVELVTVQFEDGATPGLWIPARHELARAGRDEAMTAERVLLWVGPANDVQFRLETDRGLSATLELAADVKGGVELLQESES